MLAPGSDRIPVELFQILKDDAVESAALNMQYATCTQYAICRLLADSLSLLQRIFPTQESNRSLLQCRRILYQLSCEGSQVYELRWGWGGHKYSVHNKVLLVTQDPAWDSLHLNSGVMFVGFLQTVAVFLSCPVFWMRCPALRVIRDCVESPSGGFV